MIHKDFVTVMIIFIIILFIGLRAAEIRVNAMMGIDARPRSLDLCLKDRAYDISFMGKNINLKGIYKIGDFYAERKHISITVNDKRYCIPSILKVRCSFGQRRVNLDKKPLEMYN